MEQRKDFSDSFLSVLHFILYIVLVLYLVMTVLVSIESLQKSIRFLLPLVMLVSWRLWVFLNGRVQKLFLEARVFQAYIETMMAVFVFFVINLILWNIFLSFSPA